MSVTQQEFEDKIKLIHPAKHIVSDQSPIIRTFSVFALDRAADILLDYFGKYSSATHAWSQNSVVKDTDNTFSPVSVATYIYPDGSQRTTPPTDGQHYDSWDHSGKTTWQFSSQSNSWSIYKNPTPIANNHATNYPIPNTSSSSWNSSANYFNYTKPPVVDNEEKHTTKENKKPVCECGAHKVGSDSHSDWCDLAKGNV